MRRYASFFLTSLLFCASTYAALPFEQLLYKGKAVPFYNDTQDPQKQALLDLVKQSQLAERMASVVNNTLRMKSDIGVGFEACNRVNAFFDPRRRVLVICVEFLEMVVNTAKADTDFMMKLPREQFGKVIDGLLWGIYFHELGHAIIHTNNVPITGREEDVADQFAVWFAVNFVDLNRNPIVMPTIWLWGRMAQERSVPNMTEEQRRAFMSDEHSLDEQRIYNLACWVLGTGTEGGSRTAAFAKLPQERGQRCAGEYAQVDKGMKHMFKKFFKVAPLRGGW